MIFCVTDYTGNYVYKNGNLEFFNHPEGYVEKEADGYKYVYQFKDHLGNIRLSYKDADKDGSITQDEIIEEKNYYPFGMTHSGYNTTVGGREHNYGYLNQEEQNELGLNWLTFRYRNYMPEIGRFFGVDPVSEEYYSISTYQFAHNNPVWKIELEGLEGATSTGNGNDDIINHEPVKSEQRAFIDAPVLTVTTGKVVQKTVEKTVGQKVLSGLFSVAKGAGTLITALLTPQQAHAPGSQNPVNLEGNQIDEKHKVDDKVVKTEGDSDSPVVRMGDFDKDAEPSLQDNIDFLKETSTPGRETKGKSKLFEREGGIGAATETFYFLNPENVKELDNGTLVGTLEDGSKVNVRTNSTDGRTTLEIQIGKRKIKFRFNESE